MCGRFSLQTPAPVVAQKFDAALLETWDPRDSFYPGQAVPIIRIEDGNRAAKTALWGLIPSWAKDRTIGRKTFNARSETVAEKPAFRGAFAKKRCLIPVDSFFEWPRSPRTPKGKAPTPWRFMVRGEVPFALAGLWEAWKDPSTGSVLESCAILTTRANALMQPIHDRMPVILPPDAYSLWLDPKKGEGELIRPLFEPLDAALMVSSGPLPENGVLRLELG